MEGLRKFLNLGPIRRNKIIILIVLFSFSSVIYFSTLLAFSAYLMFPELKAWLKPLEHHLEVPEFYTWDLFNFIFLNNIGHFCNPLKMLVWVPLFGVFILGLELALNGAVIGVAVVYAGLEKGPLFPAIAIIPHGILEVPAFVFQFVCFARWHATVIEFFHAKITDEKFERSKIIDGLVDAAFFAAFSLTFFFFAALIETFVTPAILDLIFSDAWRIK